MVLGILAMYAAWQRRLDSALVVRKVGRRIALPVAALLAAGPVAGCSDNEASGPLTFGSYRLVLDGQRHDPYFLIEACADDDEPARVTINDVKGRVVEGAGPSTLSFAIAWQDGPRFEPTIGGRQPLPKAFESAVGATGTIDTCGKSHASAWLAVVFPRVANEPIRVRDVTVDYDIDGTHYVGDAGVLLAQCPDNQESTRDTSGRLCRPA